MTMTDDDKARIERSAHRLAVPSRLLFAHYEAADTVEECLALTINSLLKDNEHLQEIVKDHEEQQQAAAEFKEDYYDAIKTGWADVVSAIGDLQ